jgi:hypothetical protein
MSSSLAVLGIVLVLIAIPLGMMIAPLVIGGILVAVSLRRLDRSLGPVDAVAV